MAKQTQVRGADRKAELISELEWSRAELARNFLKARSEMNPVTLLKESIVHQKTAWFTGAAITGWVLSRLRGRKKPQPSTSSTASKGNRLKEVERTGLLLTILNLLFNLFKPAITAFATRKISELSTRNNLGWRKPIR